MYGGARNEETMNFVWNTLFYKHRTEIAGEQVHTKMTLILDTDAGKHRVLKGTNEWAKQDD